MKRALALTLLLPLAACRTESTETATPEAPVDTLTVVAAPDTLAPEASGDAMPLTKTGTIRVEGSDEETTLTLVREDDFPMPFATYRPEGMTSDWSGSTEGAGAHFTMGTDNAQSTLTVFVPSGDPDDLAAWAYEVAESMGEPTQLDAFPSWVSAAYSFGGADVMGSIRAGRHNGKAFYVVETMPLDIGDGFAPRASTVLREWRWLDDGSGLSE